MVVVTTPATTHAWATPVRPVCVCVCVCVADESRWMSTRTPSGGVWRACGQSANQCVCVCGWEEPHKARHVCVSEVRRGICESVAGVAWRVRGERGHMGRQRGWWVWWPRRSLTHTPAWVAPQWAGVRGATTHTHTHSGQGGAAHTVVVVGGKGAQWWWQPHHTHSHHHHVPITPCVCV